MPGTEAAPLLDRQLWWIATALATGGGLALLFLTRRAIWVLAGVALIVLPHVYGAPQPAEYKSLAPEAVAHEFIVAVVITSLLFWLALGTLSGFPRRSAPRYELVDLHELVRRCVTFIAKETERRQIGLGVSFAATVLACELSGDYRLILPLLVATALASGLARRLYIDSVYTAELSRRGLRWRLTLDGRRVVENQQHAVDVG